MGDYGIRVSKLGIDALKSADSDLLFSSAWPSLQVVSDAVATAATVPHGLGFAPLAFSYETKDTSNPYTGERKVLACDSSVVYTTAGLRTVIFNLDISTPKTYSDNRDTSLSGAPSFDYGIRIVKDDKDINSSDMRDYILHSRCQSPLILSVLTESTAIEEMPGFGLYIIIYPYTSTIPWAYGFSKDAATSVYTPLDFGGQAYPAYGIDTTNNRIFSQYAPGAGHSGGSLVILRDPILATTQIEGSY